MTASANEFDNLDRYFRVQHAPDHFKDLAEKVTSRMLANQLPFDYRADFLRATTDTDLVPISLQLRNRDLSFQSKEGVQSAVLDLYGRITNPAGRVVQTFEDMSSRAIFQSPSSSHHGISTRFVRNPCRFGPDSTAWTS